MSLAGKTLFVTGASRGIGLAVALRAARDGANVAIAAKTTEPHRHLPGTIYTAAEEIEAAGGKALALKVDIRDEDQVNAAVEQAAQHFGGIDILVNNASALGTSGVVDTEMKRYDLMHQINARGTFVVTKACIPHLKRAANPHVLMMSPPLNMDPKAFKGRIAYVMAKLGMSMCALGMAEEFKDDGIAFNALWPRVAVATAAIEFGGRGGDYLKHCRTVDVMSDAAYVILNKPAREYTGHFLIDDTVLYEAGERDFDKYRFDPSQDLFGGGMFVNSPPPPGVQLRAPVKA